MFTEYQKLKSIKQKGFIVYFVYFMCETQSLSPSAVLIEDLDEKAPFILLGQHLLHL